MAKLKLLLIAIALSSVSYAQRYTYTVYRAIYLVYVRDSGWVRRLDRKTDDEGLYIITENNKLRITSVLDKSFIVNGDTTYDDFPGYTTMSFEAYDNQNLKCTFIIKKSKKNPNVIVYLLIYHGELEESLEYYITP